jgi:hypothetical protein
MMWCGFLAALQQFGALSGTGFLRGQGNNLSSAYRGTGGGFEGPARSNILHDESFRQRVLRDKLFSKSL